VSLFVNKETDKDHPYADHPLPAVLLHLMNSRGIMAKDLAKNENVGMSAVALSNIMTGKSWPRKKTFEKLHAELCRNEAEAQLLRNTYRTSIRYKDLKIHTGTGFDLEELPQGKQAKIAHVKAKADMARRARQKSFQQALREALDRESIPYEADYLVGDILIDFRIRFWFNETIEAQVEGEPDRVFPIEREIALVCESAPDADAERMRAMSRFIQASLLVDEAIVVVPHTENRLYRFFSTGPNSVLTDSWLLTKLIKLQKSAIDAP
jgi:transcriptional regulator with XRE-family HTH domain